MAGYNAPHTGPERNRSPSPVRRFFFGTRRFGAVRTIVTIAILILLAALASLLLIDLFLLAPGAELA